MIVIGIFVSLVFLYSLVSGRLERTVITAPILFTAAGMLTSLVPRTLYHLGLDRKGLLLIAEIGLVPSVMIACGLRTHVLPAQRDDVHPILRSPLEPTRVSGGWSYQDTEDPEVLALMHAGRPH